MRRIKTLFILIAGLLFAGCNGIERPYEGTYDQVLIYCGLGYNNLSGNLLKNFSQIQEGILPGLSYDKAIVAFCHTANGSDYGTPNPPRLIRLYRGSDGQPKADTLKTYDSNMIGASKEAIRTALDDIAQMFPSRHYGMLVSSHGTGWLPGGYDSGDESSSVRQLIPEPDRPWPPTKAICNHFEGSSKNVRWLEFSDFVDAIPMKLDYLVLDACLMGTVEVAWELKGICDYLVFSPTEIMDSGMIYTTLSWDMLSGGEADLRTYCEEYYNYYESQSGSYRSGTITLVDCSRLEYLADAFAAIVQAHRSEIETAIYKQVQRYYYSSSGLRFFYDLRDLCDKVGATEAEMARLDAALAECVLYHAETPTFFDLSLERCCGLSVYIPDPLRVRLNAFYKTLSWNGKVALVE
ncbi:MAG: hypothetical protein K5910_02730 [Bacteroidales bacterium]|nr:hypothetical protein [Bacteroidales bacterium]